MTNAPEPCGCMDMKSDLTDDDVSRAACQFPALQIAHDIAKQRIRQLHEWLEKAKAERDALELDKMRSDKLLREALSEKDALQKRVTELEGLYFTAGQALERRETELEARIEELENTAQEKSE